MDGFISSSGSKIFGVRGDRNGVDRSVMGFEGRSNLEVGVPNFKSSIPTDRGEIGFESNFGLSFEERGISNTRNPFSVVGGFTGEFTFSNGVPQFNGFISSRGDDLSVIRGETTGEDFSSVSNESFFGNSGS